MFRTSPVVDGDFLEDTPSNLYTSGRYNHAKLLLGTNADEGTLFLLFDPYPRLSQYYIAEDAPFISRAMFEQGLSEQLAMYYGKTIGRSMVCATGKLDLLFLLPIKFTILFLYRLFVFFGSLSRPYHV